MSDLTRLRDWARKMAETTKPLHTSSPSALPHHSVPREAYPTDAERVLWRQIADEIDAFIETDEPAVGGQLELTAAREPETPRQPRDPAEVVAEHVAKENV